MDRNVEKLLYSRRDAAEALSLSVRSIDYLITTNRLPTRRVGSKILIPAIAIRRFAREDHPDSLRPVGAPASEKTKSEGQQLRELARPFGPDREENQHLRDKNAG